MVVVVVMVIGVIMMRASVPDREPRAEQFPHDQRDDRKAENQVDRAQYEERLVHDRCKGSLS